MKCSIILMFLVTSHASVLKLRVVRQVKEIPAPSSVRLCPLPGPGFQIKWSAVDGGDLSDPVIGYKVKIWEWKLNDTIITECISGRRHLCKGTIPDELPITEVDPKEVFLTEGLTSSYTEVEPGHLYEVQVQAFSTKRRGEVSRLERIKTQGRLVPTSGIVNFRNGEHLYWFFNY